MLIFMTDMHVWKKAYALQKPTRAEGGEHFHVFNMMLYQTSVNKT